MSCDSTKSLFSILPILNFKYLFHIIKVAMKPNHIIQATLTSLEIPEVNRVNCYKLEQIASVSNFEGDIF